MQRAIRPTKKAMGSTNLAKHSRKSWPFGRGLSSDFWVPSRGSVSSLGSSPGRMVWRADIAIRVHCKLIIDGAPFPVPSDDIHEQKQAAKKLGVPFRRPYLYK